MVVIIIIIDNGSAPGHSKDPASQIIFIITVINTIIIIMISIILITTIGIVLIVIFSRT